MTKSKKQFATKQASGSEEFHRTVELAFSDHPWPASRTELIEHAGRQPMFAKSDLARLKRIPHRDYHNVADLMAATREADKSFSAQEAGQVTTAEHNRRAMGETPADSQMHSAARYDEQIR